MGRPPDRVVTAADGKKVTGTICRNGPKAGTMLAWSSHKWCLPPFSHGGGRLLAMLCRGGSHDGTHRILAGDPAPSVQIGWHPVNAEGLLVLAPLTRCDDPIIREGIQALLASRGALGQHNDEVHWTTFQLSDRLLAARLDSIREEWEPYVDTGKRDATWRRFREYVYQWY